MLIILAIAAAVECLFGLYFHLSGNKDKEGIVLVALLATAFLMYVLA